MARDRLANQCWPTRRPKSEHCCLLRVNQRAHQTHRPPQVIEQDRLQCRIACSSYEASHHSVGHIRITHARSATCRSSHRSKIDIGDYRETAASKWLHLSACRDSIIFCGRELVLMAPRRACAPGAIPHRPDLISVREPGLDNSH